MGNRVRDWMTYKPLTVGGETAAAEAFDLMLENGIRHLPVLEAEGELIGILSIDDLRAAFPFAVSPRRPLAPEERAEVRGHRVSDAMSWAPRTLPSSATLEEAARRLSEHRIGCLPIVDDGRLVGILSETDALRALDALLRKQRPPAGARTAEDHGVVDTLWAERERLMEQLARWQEAERELAADIHEPRDSGDRAADQRDIARLEPLSARASRRLRAIDLALERAKHGELGICERCRGRIPAIRLRAVPEATLCIRCARHGLA